ncbi:MAG: hypothetical protein LQ338_005786 [Usnochroma carphineum]|nr:MAG: hypothetical protein LQ338_005786 [Usnochroma carphineum]
MIPTFKLYDPLLRANVDTIRSVKRETFSYGPLERQQLDIYSPPEPSIVCGRRPLLMFEYGGGLVQGHRTLPMFDGLVHANLGAFFALRFGYTVVVADYRLLSHGARFPDGGEDVALAAEWICQNRPGPGSEPIDLFIMGNSAGGIHVSTFLFHSDFAAIRQKIIHGHGTRLRGVILLSVPFAFQISDQDPAKIPKQYFGDVEANCPLALMRGAFGSQGVPDVIKGGTRVFVLNAELDPEDEFLRPRDKFVKEWHGHSDDTGRCALVVDTMMGQNHFSPFLSLGTGKESEEAWGHQVAIFCDTARKLAPRE